MRRETGKEKGGERYIKQTLIQIARTEAIECPCDLGSSSDSLSGNFGVEKNMSIIK